MLSTSRAIIRESATDTAKAIRYMCGQAITSYGAAASQAAAGTAYPASAKHQQHNYRSNKKGFSISAAAAATLLFTASAISATKQVKHTLDATDEDATETDLLFAYMMNRGSNQLFSRTPNIYHRLLDEPKKLHLMQHNAALPESHAKTQLPPHIIVHGDSFGYAEMDEDSSNSDWLAYNKRQARAAQDALLNPLPPPLAVEERVAPDGHVIRNQAYLDNIILNARRTQSKSKSLERLPHAYSAGGKCYSTNLDIPWGYAVRGSARPYAATPEFQHALPGILSIRTVTPSNSDKTYNFARHLTQPPAGSTTVDEHEVITLSDRPDDMLLSARVDKVIYKGKLQLYISPTCFFNPKALHAIHSGELSIPDTLIQALIASVKMDYESKGVCIKSNLQLLELALKDNDTRAQAIIQLGGQRIVKAEDYDKQFSSDLRAATPVDMYKRFLTNAKRCYQHQKENGLLADASESFEAYMLDNEHTPRLDSVINEHNEEYNCAISSGQCKAYVASEEDLKSIRDTCEQLGLSDDFVTNTVGLPAVKASALQPH